MNIIDFIREILLNNKSLPCQLEIIINNEVFSFFEGINIIDCNKLPKEKYIIKCKNSTNVDINKLTLFSIYDVLKKIFDNKLIKYKYYLEDTTKTSFFLNIKLSNNNFEGLFKKIISLNFPDTCQYIISCIKGVQQYHYVNNYFSDSYNYNQELIKFVKIKDIEDIEYYIIIKCCHDKILITNTKITFSEKDSYSDIISLILPYLVYSPNNNLIRFIPTDISFIYPISINFQVFDLMLYKYNLYPFLYTNESNNLINNQGHLMYTLNLYDNPINMFLISKYKLFNETIHFRNLEWYIYVSMKIVLKYIYLLYIDFHINYFYNKVISFKIPIKINHNRLFGKYYTRYYVNNDKVLPVITDEEYCIYHNIPYVQWNGNFYKAPEGTGYTITLNKSRNSKDDDGIPKCVKLIRKKRNNNKNILSNISYEISNERKGLLPPTLFLSYGYELLNLYRVYFNIEDISAIFKMCPKCYTYLKIPSQAYFIDILKKKFINKQLNISEEYNYSNINILSFSVNNDMKVYPYGVLNNTYNFNSSFPFLITMLNTCKVYSRSNYRYEFIKKSRSYFFFINDDCVQAIFAMLRENNIVIVDENEFNLYIAQFITNEKITVLIAEKIISDDLNQNYYLWKSIQTNMISNVPIINNSSLNETFPPFSILCKEIKEITGYHYFKNDNKNFIVYGIWKDDIYYPCKATVVQLEVNTPNKPYLLVNRNTDGTVYLPLKNDTNYILY